MTWKAKTGQETMPCMRSTSLLVKLIMTQQQLLIFGYRNILNNSYTANKAKTKSELWIWIQWSLTWIWIRNPDPGARKRKKNNENLELVKKISIFTAGKFEIVQG
jgi:hypothetical protein